MLTSDSLYKIAETKTEFEQGKELFGDYVKSLGVDLSFQDFEKELNTIDQQYCQPTGGLIPAFKEEQGLDVWG
jgi:putative acetyltransferase